MCAGVVLTSSDASCLCPRCARARSDAQTPCASLLLLLLHRPRPLTFDMPVCFSLHLSPFLPRLLPSFLFCGGDLSLSCAQRDKFREALSAYLNCLDAFTAARKWEKSEQVMRFLLLLLLWRTLAWLLVALLLCVSP